MVHLGLGMDVNRRPPAKGAVNSVYTGCNNGLGRFWPWAVYGSVNAARRVFRGAWVAWEPHLFAPMGAWGVHLFDLGMGAPGPGS